MSLQDGNNVTWCHNITRGVIPYIKGCSEQYSHSLAKDRVRVFFKGTSTIKPLLMHPKDPIPDAQNTDIIYH